MQWQPMLNPIIDIENHTFLIALLDRSAEQNGQRTAIIDLHGNITYQQLQQRSLQAIAQLISAGIKPVQTVAILPQRSADLIIWLAASMSHLLKSQVLV